MKARRESEEKQELARVQPLLMTEGKIRDLFTVFDAKIKVLLDDAKIVKVDTSETLQVAENKSSQISEIIKEIDKARTKATRPYLDTKKKIDELAKKFSEPLESANELYKIAILAYKQLQVATESIAAEEKFSELNKVEENKKSEADRLVRIRRMVNASIYGGTYITRTGETKSKSGCQKPSDCDDLTGTLSDSFPKLDEFLYFREEAAKTLSELKAEILMHKANLIRLGSTKDEDRQSAFEAINDNRTEANIKTNEKEQKITKQIIKEVSSESRKIQSTIASAGKNITRRVAYEVIDLTLVPKEYVQLNSTAIEEYKSTNLETIKLELEKAFEMGEKIIPGIKFFFQETYTNR